MKRIKLSRKVSLLIVGLGLAVNGYSQSFLTNGLVGYYQFNGNANDASGNAANATATNVTFAVDRFGYPDQAAWLNGTSGFLTMPASQLHLAGSPQATVSQWVKLGNLDGILFGFAINTYYTPPPGPVGIGVELMPSGQLSVWTCSDSDRNFSTTFFATNLWYHLVVVYNGQATANSNKVAIYFNGVRDNVYQERSDVIPSTLPLNANWAGVGARPRGLPSTSMIGFLAGAVDDVRIYNRALTDSEVAQLYAIEAAPILNVRKAVYLDSFKLLIGTNYQVQVSSDMNTWTNYGAPFTATNSTWRTTNYWDVENWNSLYFRLQGSP